MKTAWSWLWPWSKQSGRIGSDATNVSMNSGRNNFETSLDDNRFSSIQMSLPSEGVNQSQSLNRMPALLRLNSVGEVSSVHHSEDSHTKKVGKGATATTTGIQFSSGNSLSLPADSSVSFGLGTQQSFLQRMASLKALSPTKSQYRNSQSTSALQFMKSRPLSEPVMTSSQSGCYSSRPNNTSPWGRKATLSSSFDSYGNSLSKGRFNLSAYLSQNCGNSHSVSMDSCTMPSPSQIHGFSGGAGSPSQTARQPLNAGSNVSGNINGIITSAASKLSPRVIESTSHSAAAAASTHSTQLNSHSTTSAIPAQSMSESQSHSGKEGKSLSSTEVCESPMQQVAEKSHSEISCNNKSLPITLTSLTSLPHAATVVRNLKAEFVNSDLSVAESSVAKSNDSLKASALSVSGDHSCQSSSESCSKSEENTSRMDNTNKSGHLKSSPSYNSEGSSHCPLKHIVSLSSVLFSPRKTVKKGRPSSKKQKKRQREKRKLASQATAEETSITDDSSPCGSDQHQPALSQNSASTACTFSMSESESDSVDFSSDVKHSQPKQSTPVKAQSKHPAIACFVIAPDSGSEETDDDECDNEDSSDWSADDHEGSGPDVSPIKGAAFNVALSLDSIFKQKTIPSLSSVLSAEDSESDSEPSTSASSPSAKRKGLCLTLSVSLSEEEDSSVEFGTSPRSSASSDCALFGFTTGLSIDALISKKPTVNNCKNNQKSARLKRTTNFDFDHVASHSSEESCEFDDSSQGHGSALGGNEIKEINAKWDRDYPTAGFRTCCSSFSEVVNNPNIKVRFATEPHLRTVYEVGTEERGGTWHHYALDRERFEKRIQDVGKVVLPVLQENHRVKMLERNQLLEQQMEQ